MDLTREQITAGESCGCVFMPATESQVQRLTVQRRIFHHEGRPLVATRDGGFFETHTTLVRLIEPLMRDLAPPAAEDVPPAAEAAPPAAPEIPPPPPPPPVEAEAAPAPTPAGPIRGTIRARAPGTTPRRRAAAAPPAPEPEAANPEPEAATSEPEAAEPEAPMPPPRPPRATSATVAEVDAAARTEAEEMLGDLAAAGSGGSGAKVIRRQGGGSRAPRWMTAGKARRGRLK